MKSNLEKRLNAQRTSAESLVRAEHGDDALEVLCSFTELECVADVKLKDGWIRYLLIEGGEGENDDTLRRIG
jgi:hypothetical protein